MSRLKCHGPLAACALAACGGSEAPAWSVVHEELPGALLSVWGTSETDVWAVGADAGDGPTVLRYDGGGWADLETGESGDLWWIHGFDGGPVFMGGTGGMILRYRDGEFSRMSTPGSGTVFGLWGASADAMWAVGGSEGGQSGAFAWRLDGDAWVEASGFPDGIAEQNALWKVHGRSADDVWMVGTSGVALHWNGAELVRDDVPTGTSMFTLHSTDDAVAAVGGFGQGQIFERQGGAWVDVTPSRIDPLVGVHLGPEGGFAVGDFGTVFRREAGAWSREPTGLDFGDSLHAVWMDPSGGVWAVGGETQVHPLVRGAMIYRGELAPQGTL